MCRLRLGGAAVYLVLSSALAAACHSRTSEPVPEPVCNGSVAGDVVDEFDCDASVTFDLATSMTTIALARVDDGGAQSSLYPPSVGVTGEPVVRTYSTDAVDVVWAVAAVNTLGAGYYASKAFPELTDCGTISITVGSVELLGDGSGVRTYSLHGSFEAALCNVDPALASTVTLTGFF
jgi:hypothetical protein